MVEEVTRLRPPRRKVSIGRMDRRIVLQARGIVGPQPGQTKIALSFDKADEIWASLTTRAAREFFDGVNLVKTCTHIFSIRWRPNVTQELALFCEGEIYDILDVEDLEERHEFLLIRCNVHGDQSITVNQG